MGDGTTESTGEGESVDTRYQRRREWRMDQQFALRFCFLSPTAKATRVGAKTREEGRLQRVKKQKKKEKKTKAKMQRKRNETSEHSCRGSWSRSRFFFFLFSFIISPSCIARPDFFPHLYAVSFLQREEQGNRKQMTKGNRGQGKKHDKKYRRLYI